MSYLHSAYVLAHKSESGLRSGECQRLWIDCGTFSVEPSSWSGCFVKELATLGIGRVRPSFSRRRFAQHLLLMIKVVSEDSAVLGDAREARAVRAGSTKFSR